MQRVFKNSHIDFLQLFVCNFDNFHKLLMISIRKLQSLFLLKRDSKEDSLHCTGVFFKFCDTVSFKTIFAALKHLGEISRERQAEGKKII